MVEIWEIYGGVEMQKKVDVRFQVPVEFREKMRKYALETGQTIPAWVHSVVVMYMEQKEVEKKIPADVFAKFEKRAGDIMSEMFKDVK